MVLYLLFNEGYGAARRDALNRAVAIAEVDGAAAGLAALEGVRLPPGMAGYYLWDAVVGDLLVRADRPAQARPYLARAAAAAPTDAERALLARRLARCDAVLEARPQEFRAQAPASSRKQSGPEPAPGVRRRRAPERGRARFASR